MNPAFAVGMLSLVLLASAGARAQAPARSVAEVHKALEAARRTLADAVRRIEKDPPSTQDLDAAHAAVGALKEAIDAGAEHEAADLDYAKSALAARKELRTQREYVDQRRANIHIHNHRRTLDEALGDVNERTHRVVETKEPSAKDFEDAREAVDALKKAVGEARPFGKQDAKFATYLGELDATVARQAKALDDRWVQLWAGKQRAFLEESQKALSASLATLAKGGGTDGDFEAADKALAALGKRLEEGKPLEAKDKAYRTDADKARGEVAAAKKRMDELLSQTALERLKSEIEPAHKDLAAAAKGLKGRKPTEEQLAEARTAALVVRKLVEKFQPQAERSKAFGQYVAEVKKTLVEVEVTLQQRSLDAARAELVQAMRAIEKRDVSDEQFEEVNTAVVVLEKTIETVHKRDPLLMKPVADARELIRESRANLAKRRMQVEVQRHRAKIQEARKTAEAAVKAYQQPDPAEDALPKAEEAIKAVTALLEEGAPLRKKDGDYVAYDKETKERLKDLTERIASRKVALAAAAGRGQLGEKTVAARSALETAKKPESTDEDLEAAGKAVEALAKTLEGQGALEKQDKGYAARAESARNELYRLQESLELARQARSLRKQTGEALAAGNAATNAAAADGSLRAQKEQYEKAISLFKSCEEDGNNMTRDNVPLSKITILVDGTPSTPKAVIASCAERAKSAEQSLRQVLSLLGFEEGPKKFFEAGKTLLARRKAPEALNQFDECIASGRIHAYRYPEVKERKFEVAGASMTLGELIDQCVNQRKALVKK